MAQQLESVVHFDFDPNVIRELAPTRKTVMITDCEGNGNTPTFKEFMTNGNTDFFELLGPVGLSGCPTSAGIIAGRWQGATQSHDREIRSKRAGGCLRNNGIEI
jgi:hypothetical protein